MQHLLPHGDRRADRANLVYRVSDGSGHALDDPDGKWIRRDFLDELARWICAMEIRAVEPRAAEPR